MEVNIGVPTEVPMQIQRRITPGGAAFAAAVLGLQVFLSRRKRRWPGLILPVACGVYALGVLLTFSRVPAETGAFLLALVMLLPAMIAAALLLVVYALCRRSLRRRKKEDVTWQE